MAERHLILGGGGFLGRHLARSLLNHGAAVTLADRAFPPALGLELAERRDVDLLSLDSASLAALLDGHDVVHHLAWSSIPATAHADPDADLRENVGLTAQLLVALRGSPARLVFVSSGGTVYGRAGSEPISESRPLQPISAYGAGKAAAELYIGAAWAGDGVDARIARISNLYGAGQSSTQAQGALTRFTLDALAGRPLEIWGDGSVVRDFIHIVDAVGGVRRIAAADRAALEGHHVFNLGSGAGASLNSIAELVQAIVGGAVEVTRRPAARRAFDLPYNVLDIRRAAAVLNWTPALSLRDGVGRMAADLRRDPQALFSSR